MSHRTEQITFLQAIQGWCTGLRGTPNSAASSSIETAWNDVSLYDLIGDVMAIKKWLEK
ncbi:hypothetical protein [Cellulophaga sp. Hel_I_12]|uniref:hypothetical protein n=1 Tax=Cellulophaga sp. Hel_I_12 TaxID=1249972 RepID=UPI000A4AC113|nr:hypothetical protein [Cellulophaga sp. Hel_I_12]